MKKIFWRRLFLTHAAVVFIAFTSSSVMASGFTITEKGTKGLGNAWAGGAAVAEDASTVYWNPAGLTRLSGNEVDFSLHLIRPSFEFKKESATTLAGATIQGGDGGDAGGTEFVPNLFYTHDISENWKAGIGFYFPFGLTTEYDSGWVGRYYTIRAELVTLDINPSVAHRINNQWSVGGGISAQYIDAKLTNAIDWGLITGANTGGNPAFDGDVKLTGDDWSFGFNLGALFELSENTRFGLAYRSQISHKVTGSADFNTPAFATGAATFLGLVDQDISADIDLPANISLSGYHQFNAKWAIMGNIIWTDWSVLDELRIEFPNTTASDNVTTLKWDDSYYYAVGVTWYCTDQWTFRGGLAYDETPVPSDELRSPRVPDDDRFWISAGGSYKFSERWGLDFAGTYIIGGDPGLDKIALPAPDENATRGNLLGEYDAWAYILSAQINYQF